MNQAKKISPQAILSLRDALSVIYWKKDDLQEFLKLSINNNTILATVNWSLTKRDIAKEIIERMTNRLDLYQDDLILLFTAVTDFEDFTNLKFWDDDGSKTRKAKEAVDNLRKHTKGFIELTREQEVREKRKAETNKRINKAQSLSEEIKVLKDNFDLLATTKDVQKRGYQLEKFLYDLFLLYDLEPKGSFKNYGEQIDGAFTFQSTDYLLEAKWKRQVDRGEIAAFCYKVETKFKTAVGLLVTIDGVTSEAISQDFKSIIIMDGFDISSILEGHVSLPDLLFRKRRKAIETGKIYLNYHQL